MGGRGVGVGGGRERSEIPFDTAEKLRCDFNHLTAASAIQVLSTRCLLATKLSYLPTTFLDGCERCYLAHIGQASVAIPTRSPSLLQRTYLQ